MRILDALIISEVFIQGGVFVSTKLYFYLRLILDLSCFDVGGRLSFVENTGSQNEKKKIITLYN